MARDPRYDLLFEPVKIGPVTAPNRFFAVPHATGHSPLMPNGAIAMRAMKAEGGWGVVAMQLAEIDPTSDISNLPMEKFWDETDVRSHARMVEKIKSFGSLTAIEIGHTGLRSRNMATGYPVFAPSCLPILKPEAPVQAKAMDKTDIRDFRRSHRAAVARAKQAGYDIVYVYAAHDASLLWHFLTPLYNFRNDEYGGSFENRIRLLREVLEDAQDEAGGEIAIAIRFAVHDFKTGSPLTCDREGRAVVERLAEIPDLWDVNVAGWSRDSGTSRFDDEGFQERYTGFVKQVTTKPVVGVGRFTSPDAMVSQIRRGILDFIGGARPSIADPFLPSKIRDGRGEDIRECIGCNVCVASDSYSVPLRCTQNPTISEEWRRDWHPEKVNRSSGAKSIMIVGAGPAGLECALTLARAGHKISIADKAERLGGRVARESRLFGLAAWSRVADHRIGQLSRMQNVEVFPASDMSQQDVAAFDADHVFIATGAHWRDDGLGRTRFEVIPGFVGNATTPDDIMSGAAIQGSVVIYDDDHYYMGNVLALHLAGRGFEVHLVCPQPIIGGWLNYTLEQPRVISALLNAGVHMYPNSTAVGWSNGSLSLMRTDTGGSLPAIEARHLIAVSARLPNALPCEPSQPNITIVGDCVAPGTIQNAVYSGHLAARQYLGEVSANKLFKRETATLQ